MQRGLDWIVRALEWISAAILAILGVLAVGSFFVSLVEARGALVSGDTITSLLDELLVLFLVIELFKMATAYMRGDNIIPVALEAVIVALARKAVALDLSVTGAFKKAAAIAILTAAVGVAWFLIGRSRWGCSDANA